MTSAPVSWWTAFMHLARALRKPRRWLERVAERRLSRIHLWGSGSFGPSEMPGRAFVRVHALRGERSREAMGLGPGLPLGDPGLLVDRLELPAAPRVRWGIIPHVDDAATPGVGRLAEALAGARVIDLTDPDIPATIARIRACEFVVSSSLHGLITADAFGVPNLWASLRPGFYGGDWKFHDYFSGVGRSVAGPLDLRDGGAVPERAALEAAATVADAGIVAARKAGLESAFRGMGL